MSVRTHPNECDGVHDPIIHDFREAVSPPPLSECKRCGTNEREAWAAGETIARHMHDYSNVDGGVVRCDCGAWLPKSWHAANLAEGKAVRAKRLERYEKLQEAGL